MKECRINFQNDIIENILDALKTCGAGIGIAKKYNYEVESGTYSSTLVFTPKDGNEMNTIDFFMFGYFVGRDY